MERIIEKVAARTLVLKKGERYIGTVLSADGKRNHVILLPGDELGNWEDSMALARERGGDLPNRVEQALLFRGYRAEFQPDWYWSNTQYGYYAWGQEFGRGNQFYNVKTRDGWARAVRRVRG